MEFKTKIIITCRCSNIFLPFPIIGTVSGTPQFLVNGVGVGASSSWTVDDWKKVIDPLLGKAILTKVLHYSIRYHVHG